MNKNIENLLNLIKENPELRIVPMVDTNVIASDESAWWIAKFGSTSVEEIWDDGEAIYIRSQHKDYLIERLADDTNEDINEDEVFKKIENEVNSYEWKKVIAVKIHV